MNDRALSLTAFGFSCAALALAGYAAWAARSGASRVAEGQTAWPGGLEARSLTAYVPDTGGRGGPLQPIQAPTPARPQASVHTSDVEAVFRASDQDVAACLPPPTKTPGAIAPKLTIMLVVDSDGHVQDARAAPEGLPDSAVQCALAKMKRVTFPPGGPGSRTFDRTWAPQVTPPPGAAGPR